MKPRSYTLITAHNVRVGGRYISGKAGRAADLGKTYFRSQAERNYARYLNWLKSKGEIQNWEYEPKTFWFDAIRRGVVSYKPDFRITENDDSQWYAEVKGYMCPKDLIKQKRMAKYYPEVRIAIIDTKHMKEIAKWAKMIPNWE